MENCDDSALIAKLSGSASLCLLPSLPHSNLCYGNFVPREENVEKSNLYNRIQGCKQTKE